MSGSTEWRTPPEFFAKLHREFGFNVDAAATPENAMVGNKGPCGERPALYCSRCRIGRYYTACEDGTKREHYGPGDVVWCNPPYSNVEPWLRVASETARIGALWVLLLAPSTDARWFHRFIWDAELNRPRDRVEVRFLPGRIRFIHPDPKKRVTDFKGFRPISGNMIVIFRPPLEARP